MEFLFFGWFIFTIMAAIVAASKGRSVFGWLILGFFFSLLALILVALLPSLKKKIGDPTPETHVRCPDCREFVFKDATKCKHCGTRLVPVVEGPSAAEEFGRRIRQKISK